MPKDSTKPFTIEDLNSLASQMTTTGVGPDPEQAIQLLDLAVRFRNALREIQVCGNTDAKDIASRALAVRRTGR